MITLTDKAIRELSRIMKDQNLPLNTNVRVGVKGGGCSGFSYTFGFDYNITELDQVNKLEDLTLVCDPKSFLYINGMEIDFEDTLMGRGFKFKNPSAAKSCGCGESFSV